MFKLLSRCSKYANNNIFKFSKMNGYSTSTVPLLDLEINRMVWVDMEMTGLDIEKDRVMEIACLVTDANLNIVAESPDFIIHQPPEILSQMNEWCLTQHKKSGLTDACLKSTTTIQQAEDHLLDFLSKYVTENVSPLAGSSVYMDRLFLRKYMPRLNSYLHYRIIDVSTVKELCRRWNPDLYRDSPKKEFGHRALADIRESVQELKFYKERFFKLN